MKAALIFAGLCSTAAAFQSRPQHHAIRHVMQPLNNVAELNPVDEMCIENVAEFCLHESCDIEEYEALINQLEEQKNHFIKHVANVENLLNRLKDSNHPEHDPDDVKMLMDDIKGTLANPPSTTKINGADDSDAAPASSGVELWSVDYDAAARLAYEAAGAEGDFAAFKSKYLEDTSAMVSKKGLM